jgi:DNA-binding response OmpR family regulator
MVDPYYCTVLILTVMPTMPSENPKDAVPSDNKKVILIVEDDPVLLKMYSEKFGFEGFKVLVARDGGEALKVAEIEKIDAILLDIMLPRISGTDFLEKFRGSAKGKNIPVIALTNLAAEEEKQRAIKLGVEEYLVKAMQTPEDVVEKVKKYL